MGKRTVPIYLLNSDHELSDTALQRLSRVNAEDQGVDGTCFIDGQNGRLNFSLDEERANLILSGLRAAGASTDVGLDPCAFAVESNQRPSPFPGLRAYGDDDADAAIFFGRSREIAEILEMLRRMRASKETHPLVLFGASGAGKSSLLRAGVIPRLRREVPAWITLRAFRPGSDPLFNFAEAISTTLLDYGQLHASGVIKSNLLEAWRKENAQRDEATRSGVLEALEGYVSQLRLAAGRPNATVLMSVDQAEELVRAGGESGDAFSDYIKAALVDQSNWQLVFTIRTDSFSELQESSKFSGIETRGYDLRAMPVFRFDDVIKKPAERYGITIADKLIDRLIEDSPGSDALPLLAFALERLWRQFSGKGELKLQDYETMGGLSGLIEDAAERALAGTSPSDKDALLQRIRPKSKILGVAENAFVPSLADVNDEGKAIRRVASWNSFDPEQQELLQHFDAWRLVVRRGGEIDTVEVAHEALFREWSRLRSWLEPERDRLELLRGLQSAAASWSKSNQSAEYLTHFGSRLRAAEHLRRNPKYVDQISANQLDYLAQCRKTERKNLRRRNLLQLTVVATLLLFATSLIAFMNRETVIPLVSAQLNFRPHVQSSKTLMGLHEGESFFDCAPTSNNCPEMLVTTDGAHPNLPISRVAVSRHKITFDNWKACVRNGGCQSLPEPIGSGQDSGSDPVVNVSWLDVNEYTYWLSQMTGKKYRLLSESEWLHLTASTEGFSISNQEIWEWVQDCGGDPADRPLDGSARETVPCTARVRVAIGQRTRAISNASSRRTDLGFRVAHSIEG